MRGPVTRGASALASALGALALLAPLPLVAEPLGVVLGGGVSAYADVDHRWGLVPELSVRVPLTPARGLALEPTVRLGYRGLSQPPQPQGLALRERDLVGTAELAVGWAGAVRPTLTVGAGVIARSLALDTSEMIDTSDARADRRELLPLLTAQVGLGLPARDGTLVVEPYARYGWSPDDDRLGLTWGLELRVALR